MTQLEDDIARVAALRRKDAAPYQEAAKRPKESVYSFSDLFAMHGHRAVDMDAYDRLPALSREEVGLAPRPINATVWFELIKEFGGNERALIAQYRAHLEKHLDGAYKPIVAVRRRRTMA